MAWRDTAARFLLRVTAWRVSATRFRLAGANRWRDTAARYFLLVALWRVTAARFRLVSAVRWRDTGARSRLSALSYRHTGTRFAIRPALVIQAATADAPVALAFVAAGAAGDSFDNHERTVLVVRNTSGGPVTVTAIARRACDMGTKHDGVAVVAAGTTAYIGPFDATRFNDAARRVSLAYSSVTGVSVAVTRTV